MRTRPNDYYNTREKRAQIRHFFSVECLYYDVGYTHLNRIVTTNRRSIENVTVNTGAWKTASNCAYTLAIGIYVVFVRI